MTLGRIGESEDDELAYAYFAANHPGETYDRKRFTRAYARRAYAVYRRHHVERGIAMVLKATGLTPSGRLNRWLTALACWFMQVRVRRLDRRQRLMADFPILFLDLVQQRRVALDGAGGGRGDLAIDQHEGHERRRGDEHQPDGRTSRPRRARNSSVRNPLWKLVTALFSTTDIWLPSSSVAVGVR